MDRIRLKYNQMQSEIPNVMEHWHEQLFKGFKAKQLDIIKERCAECGYEFRADRIVCVVDSDNNELYYYQTDSGSLEPIIAITPMEVSNRDTNNSIIVTLDCQELHMDIFKPKA